MPFTDNGNKKNWMKRFILTILPDYLLVILKKINYVHKLKNFSVKDECDLKMVKYFVNPGDYVIDIGANIGWYTKVLSQLVKENGRVFSIEPIPLTFDLLIHCLNKLNISNVELLNYGISDKNGSVTMEIPLYESGGENYYEARIVNDKKNTSLRSFQINIRSLDSLFKDSLNKISFIKCDVEGHELSVMRGAKELIAKFKPAWIIEISEDPDREGSDAYELFHYLGQEGYSPWWFNGERLIRRSLRDTSVNYFFLQDYHRKKVPEKYIQMD